MKNNLSLALGFFLLLFFGLVSAQKYKISYEMNFKRDPAATTLSKTDMILLVDQSKSIFLNRKHYEGDSLAQTQTLSNGLLPPRSLNFKQMVKKDHEAKTYSEYLRLSREIYKTKSPLPKLDWKITSETQTIGEYKVQKALLSHSGREWEAWFTPDISIAEGPSVFYGLPGLILSMKDSKGDYEFNFTGIKKEENLNVDYQFKEPLQISKAQRSKLLIDYYKNPIRDTGEVSSLSNLNVRKESIQKDLRADNNPVELKDAIPYP
ncbi:GLPGLI family protein [Chryseobacterium sp. A301]